MSELLVDVRIPFPSNLPFGRGKELLEQINAAPCATADEYVALCDLLKGANGHANEIEEGRKFGKRPIIDAGRTHDEYYRPEIDACEKAVAAAKVKISAYQREQERVRREEQRKADEKADRERKRQEAIAANEREAARLAALRNEPAKAAKAEARAERAEEKAAVEVAPIIDRAPPKVAGIASREIWRAECNDLRALVEAIARGEQPLSLVMANDKVIGQQARSLQKDFVCPGIRVWPVDSIAAGRR